MIYDFKCDACGKQDDRFIRLADYEKERGQQKCECGATMRRVIGVPTLKGLDSGPDGFMRGRMNNDGCPDDFTRERVRKNNGGSLGGGMFVPGLCRPGKPFDSFAVCHSREDVVKKARKLGVAVRGPGINVEPRQDEADIKAREEDDGVPSERAMRYTIREEVQKNHGGRVSGKKYREIVEKLKDRHRRKTPPKTTKVINSIYGND